MGVIEALGEFRPWPVFSTGFPGLGKMEKMVQWPVLMDPPDKVESLSSRFAPFSLILLPQFSLLFLFVYLNHCFGFCMSLIVGTLRKSMS
ncbi:hypothetical protein NXS19_010613 [Fusarium pseudograminearum]|nr:hypothetical protein NXS19_010613 [Fusarium pseudograminearum]